MTDWTETPAPNEAAMPPARVIERAPMESIGCWVGVARGIYAPVDMVKIAVDNGWEITDEDREVLHWAEHSHVVAEPSQAHMPDVWHEIIDDAEAWMNDAMALPGCSFGWDEGDFFYLTNEQWCERSDDDECYDLDHGHEHAA